MEFTSWEFWTLVTRWLLYIGMAAAIGGAFSLHLMKAYGELKAALLRYTLVAALVAIMATLGHFFVRVGAMLEEGFAGMFEPDMVAILWESAVGDALLLRAFGLLLILFSLLAHAFLKGGSSGGEIELNILEVIVALVGIGLLTSSFTEAGHGVSQPLFFQFILAVHVLLTAWWMGSLYPLWLLCHRLDFNDAYALLERFGKLAVGAVLVLFAGGLYMSYQLTGWNNLLSDSYGILLVIKVILVVLILMLAALHKLVLVPQLLSTQNASKLKQSIMLEKFIGAGIFGITTILTTLVGPTH